MIYYAIFGLIFVLSTYGVYISNDDNQNTVSLTIRVRRITKTRLLQNKRKLNMTWDDMASALIDETSLITPKVKQKQEIVKTLSLLNARH